MKNKKIKLGGTETEKYNFYKHKNPKPINDVDVNKILSVFNTISFGKKSFQNFIVQKDGKKSHPYA